MTKHCEDCGRFCSHASGFCEQCKHLPFTREQGGHYIPRVNQMHLLEFVSEGGGVAHYQMSSQPPAAAFRTPEGALPIAEAEMAKLNAARERYDCIPVLSARLNDDNTGFVLTADYGGACGALDIDAGDTVAHVRFHAVEQVRHHLGSSHYSERIQQAAAYWDAQEAQEAGAPQDNTASAA